MITLIKSLIHEPLLSGAVMFCLLVIGGLVLSDWADKRRDRNLLKLRDAAREAYQRGAAHAPPAVPQREEMGSGIHKNRPVFRLFRWKFALFAAVAVALVLPRIQDSLEIRARSRVDVNTSSTVVTVAKPPRESPSPTPPLVQNSSSIPEFLQSARLSLAGSDIPDSSLSLKGPRGKVDYGALFEFDSRMEWDSQSESIEGEFRKNYPVQASSFSTLESQRRSRIGGR